MSERMTPIPFRSLMDWIVAEHEREGSVFGIHRPYIAGERTLPIFGEKIEMPFGPAAGPNTQLAQNIIAGYFAGARFFELKTVQRVDGPEMAACISRPCILAEDECYNCEWSTELTVPEAFGEYVKAWCACKMLARLYGLGDPGGVVFNMSVGYDLEGIQSPKIDRFLNEMADASGTAVFRECIQVLKTMFPGEAAFIDGISPRVSHSVTVSTLHGCPSEEIERIAAYLLMEKRLHTAVKCNPTLLGCETVRGILDAMGYGYISFDERHFREDLQYGDAVPMFRRLQKLAGELELEFGLKLSNTFPVEVRNSELPSGEMYMAGRSLFPLTIEMVRRISRDLDGVRLSYSGGADFFNIGRIFQCGVWPVTMATTELKPGGCQRFTQIAEKLENLPFAPFSRVDTAQAEALALSARSDPRHIKGEVPPKRKLMGKAPLIDCFTAPCQGGCPIGQDIPAYMELCRQERYAEALEVILEKNPLPFITGTTCYHHCEEGCTRNFYDRSVQIRETKLLTAERGYEAVLAKLKPSAPVRDGKKAAVIGGGPAGMSAAFFCAREGVPVTVFEKGPVLGGILRQVIPAFREDPGAIDRDASFLYKMGAEVRLNTEAPALEALRDQGYTHILFAVGAKKAGSALLAQSGVELGEGIRTNLEGVFIAGDACRGVSSVAEGIADAAAFAEAVTGKTHSHTIPADALPSRAEAVSRKGVLREAAKWEGERCLGCSVVCQVCADVCPNRANVVVKLPDGRAQVLHVDRMCNECGNCRTFCPYDSAPYREKLTLFHDRAGFDESPENPGFLLLEDGTVLVRLGGRVEEIGPDGSNSIPADVGEFIHTVLTKYRYLL